MFARVTRYEGDPDKLEAATKLIKETIAPGAKRLQGFQGGYWLVDRATGKGFSVTLFESEAALHATEDDAAQLRSRASAVSLLWSQISGAKISRFSSIDSA